MFYDIQVNNTINRSDYGHFRDKILATNVFLMAEMKELKQQYFLSPGTLTWQKGAHM